jgi:hypothetical protein
MFEQKSKLYVTEYLLNIIFIKVFRGAELRIERELRIGIQFQFRVLELHHDSNSLL